MKTATIICVVALCLFSAIAYSCSRRITRTLLTENRVYHWKVYHIAENNYPAGKNHYYEVYYGDKQLILPAEMTGGLREVSSFVAAGSYDAGATNYDAIFIIFESYSKDQRGFEQRGQMSIAVRPEPGHTGQFIVTNLCNGKTVTLEIETKK